jgi:hypothetical protein
MKIEKFSRQRWRLPSFLRSATMAVTTSELGELDWKSFQRPPQNISSGRVTCADIPRKLAKVVGSSAEYCSKHADTTPEGFCSQQLTNYFGPG